MLKKLIIFNPKNKKTMIINIILIFLKIGYSNCISLGLVAIVYPLKDIVEKKLNQKIIKLCNKT